MVSRGFRGYGDVNLRLYNFADGSSYAFVSLTIEEQDPPVEDMGQELQNYEHLQHLNLAKNGVRDISSMAYLLHLLTVNVSNNAIGSIKFLEELGGSERLQFLQVSELPCCFKYRNRFGCAEIRREWQQG